MAKALTGPWRDEQGFMLTQALALFDFSTRQLAACEAQIERQLAAMQPRFASDEPAVPLPRVKPGSKSQHHPSAHARPSLARLTGVDLSAVTGISASIAQTLRVEIGTAMSKFPTVKHCCSWLGLAPPNDISGGRGLRSRTRNVVNRATQAFRQAALSVARSDSAFGASFRSMRARLGPPQAIVATAHQIARVVYHLFQHHEAFQEESAAA
jgi:transposase